jgi:L-iditol 2-dehydrogenase
MMEMPNRSAVLSKARSLEVLDRPIPVAGADHVLVEVRAVGVCGSDVHYYEHGRIGSYVVNHPMVVGHEAAGVIFATGAAVTGRLVGERVALEPGVPCRGCAQCLHGPLQPVPRCRVLRHSSRRRRDVPAGGH